MILVCYIIRKTKCLYGHLVLWVKVTQEVTILLNFVAIGIVVVAVFSLSRDLERPSDYSHVSHTPTKFGGHKHHCSGYIMVLVYYVISQDHVTKGSSKFIRRSPLELVTILPSLKTIGIVVEEIK